VTSEREPLDPGAYIGNEPEREAETIPGGVTAKDERVAASASRPGVEGEPDVVTDREGSSDLEALPEVDDISPKDPPSGANATDR
jgi:hypothetical protein